MKFIIGHRQKKQKKAMESKPESENLMNSQWGGDGGERDINEMEKKHELKTVSGKGIRETEMGRDCRNGLPTRCFSTHRTGMDGTSHWGLLRDQTTSSISSSFSESRASELL